MKHLWGEGLRRLGEWSSFKQSFYSLNAWLDWIWSVWIILGQDMKIAHLANLGVMWGFIKFLKWYFLKSNLHKSIPILHFLLAMSREKKCLSKIVRQFWFEGWTNLYMTTKNFHVLLKLFFFIESILHSNHLIILGIRFHESLYLIHQVYIRYIMGNYS